MDDDVIHSSVAYQLHPVHFNDGDGERFWSQVDVTDDAEDCWLWKGPLTGNGYGSFWVFGHTERAHRVAYVLTVGEGLTDVDMICHVPHCSYRRCVNPAHLYKGDAYTNAQDRTAIGKEVSAARARANEADVKAHQLEVEAARVARAKERAYAAWYRYHVIPALKEYVKDYKRRQKEQASKDKS